MSADYRRDIDGLRGLAVGIVVLFHAFPLVLPGGFVGVDVFFVISGFLISGIIFSNLERDRFSFIDFYQRRARRIFPALIVVLVTVLAFGWLQMHARAYARLGLQTAAGAGFASNILSWTEAGYFSSASETKPLLHLWSLGIEEQFYLVWPPLVLLVWRWKQRLVPIIVVLAALSFAANVLRIDNDPSGTFYLPFTRLWELLAGACVARGRVLGPTDGRRPTLLSIAGVLFILLAAITFDERAFPGWRALLPVLGTCALLVAGPSAWVNRVVFSTSLAVSVGLISYPLYLWHWPLLTFGHLVEGTTPSATYRLEAVVLSVGLAWATYALVEKRMRFGERLREKAMGSFAGLLVVGVAAALIWRQQGIPRRAANKVAIDVTPQLAWLDPVADPKCVETYGFKEETDRKEAVFCQMNAPPEQIELAILGDSIGNSLYPGLSKALTPQHVGVVNLGLGTCAPFRGQRGTFPWNLSCEQMMRKIYTHVLENPRIHTVLLSFDSWDFDNMNFGLPAGVSQEEKFKALTKLARADIDALIAAHKRVIASFDAQNFGHDIAQCTDRPGRKANECRFPDPKTTPIMRFLPWWQEWFGPMQDVCVFDQSPPLERNGAVYVTDATGMLLYRDGHHLSFAGSDLVAHAFLASPCAKSIEGHRFSGWH